MASSPSAVEAKVTAEMLAIFVQLVEWPAAIGSNALTLCVLGHDPVEAELPAVFQNKRVDGRSVQLLFQPKGISTIACDVAFIARDEAPSARKQLAQLRKSGVLTVSNAPEFLEVGGHIGLFLEDGRMRFELNPDAARRSSLKVSSRLAKLAVIRKPKID